MATFSVKSLLRLGTCDPRLQDIAKAALEICSVDFGIACGWRGEAEQNDAVRRKLSKTPWPTSNHNNMVGSEACSLAVDVLPYLRGRDLFSLSDLPKTDPNRPSDAEIEAAFRAVWDAFQSVAQKMGVRLRWGGDWDGDGKTRSQGDADERFVDLPHIEIR